MTKPGKSQRWIVAGVIMQGIGGAIYAGGLVNSITGGSTGAMPFGAILAFIGWLVLIRGISRASAGIDYLVSLAPDPATKMAAANAVPPASA
jgi:hypothetical protein